MGLYSPWVYVHEKLAFFAKAFPNLTEEIFIQSQYERIISFITAFQTFMKIRNERGVTLRPAVIDHELLFIHAAAHHVESSLVIQLTLILTKRI